MSYTFIMDFGAHIKYSPMTATIDNRFKLGDRIFITPLYFPVRFPNIFPHERVYIV